MFHKRVITFAVTLVSVLVCLSSFSLAEEKTPDATLTLSGGSVGAGLGYQWGKGTLTYKGKTYDIEYNGLSFGELGGSGRNISGSVYNLKNVDDFVGRYAALKTGIAVAAGGEVSTMSNDKGVKIDLQGVERGIKLSFGTEGLKFSFADESHKKQG